MATSRQHSLAVSSVVDQDPERSPQARAGAADDGRVPDEPPRPPYLPATQQLPFQRRIYSVIAGVTLHRLEDDLDYHLVLRSGSRTMIAETPSPLCTKGAAPLRRKQMATTRRTARVCARARVVGVAFFD